MAELAFNFTFSDFYKQQGLEKLDKEFLEFLKKSNQELSNQLLNIRASFSQNKAEIDDHQESEFIIKLAPYVEDFINQLFIFGKDANFKQKTQQLENLYKCKRIFIQRKALKNSNMQILQILILNKLAKIL